jgi:predicted transglutaminase-like cysteine proteinase
VGQNDPRIVEIPERGLDGGATGIVIVFAIGLVILAGVLALDACSAMRAEEEMAAGNRAYQEALAYQVRERAEAEADAERAATRQMELAAAHQRALDTLPYLAGVGGLVIIGVLAMILVYDIYGRYRSQSTDPHLLLYIDQIRLELADRDRALWGAMGQLTRRLPAEVDREVVPYRD